MRGKRGAGHREEEKRVEEPPAQGQNLGDLDLDDDDEEVSSQDAMPSGSELGSEDVLEGPLSSDDGDGEEGGQEGPRQYDPAQDAEDDAAIEHALQEYLRATQNLRAQGPGYSAPSSSDDDEDGHQVKKIGSHQAGLNLPQQPRIAGANRSRRRGDRKNKDAEASKHLSGALGSGAEGLQGEGHGGSDGHEGHRGSEGIKGHGGSEGQGGSDDDDDGNQGRPLDPGSDSSEDERENRNTVGNVPLWWYKDEDHIGYDKDGRKIVKKGRGDRLDALLQRNDSKKAMRTIYDEYNDEEVVLSKDELRMIMAIRKGQFPHVEVNPYEPYVDWFTRDQEKMPINGAPEPKRRFVPSKHEEQKIVKLVRAIRKGWLKTEAQKERPEEPPVYLMWGDDGLAGQEGVAKTATGLTYIPPAKPKLPGHAESYNPPAEYIPTEEEVAGYAMLDPEDRPKLVPRKHNSLREVPAYSRLINDIFERCLDLYLCPRVRRKRLHVDPESLVPKLPKPADLQPFPTTLAMRYEGHKGKVRSIVPDASGQWLLSGSDDGTAKMWEVRTGRCTQTWDLGSPVASVAWCPAAGMKIVSAVAGNTISLLPSSAGSEEEEVAGAQAIESALDAAAANQQAAIAAGTTPLATWSRRAGGGIDVTHKFQVKHVAWHSRGDYFSTVAPAGNTQAVLVHQLSKGATQNPFRKNRGRVQRVAFHPTKPFFFVASQNHVRIYNLAKQVCVFMCVCMRVSRCAT
ncbi:NUC169 domain-containing protein [Dunaliella salina]|uniref:NUC169 domain-containing protein n=1 Tax=Dunaliella salina TaxID=3046 RepID=A0ABQ7FZ55_DUNSA|nr:NUC169 domain-containing protein [Dunaliella salina]|eukprot:KAF5827641.1 NUC169 domain-containing protein [Dunaliella salina]